MLDPKDIISWLDENVKGMRRSRIKTLAHITSAAMRRLGCGVLSLGRAMAGRVSAKHCIKRVWRFLRNRDVECSEVYKAIFHKMLPRDNSALIVLMDWTEMHPVQTLVLALAHDGRSIPVFSKTLHKKCGPGSMGKAEAQALRFVATALGRQTPIIVVADRGFGYIRFVRLCQKFGLHYLFRVTKEYYFKTDNGTNTPLKNLNLRADNMPSDWGCGILGQKNPFSTRLVSSAWQEGSAEPWFLITDTKLSAARLAKIYSRRMWIEAMFRDIKNERWGLGAAAVRLSEPSRHDRHFLVLFLAYFFLTAFGVVAETNGLAKGLKANTVQNRVLSLATIGFLAMETLTCSIKTAILHLHPAPT